MQGIHRWPVNSPHKRPVTRKMFPFDDIIMILKITNIIKYESVVFLFLKFLYLCGRITFRPGLKYYMLSQVTWERSQPIGKDVTHAWGTSHVTWDNESKTTTIYRVEVTAVNYDMINMIWLCESNVVLAIHVYLCDNSWTSIRVFSTGYCDIGWCL